MRLGIIAALVLLLNLPFGCWRARQRKFSLQWFLAVHLPVPLVIAMRIFGGIGWHVVTYPVLVGSYFAGQLIGSRLPCGRPRQGL